MNQRPIFKTNRIKDIEISNILKDIQKDVFLKYQFNKQFEDIFNILGYDLNGEFIYSIIDRDTLLWQTTKNKQYPNNVWNYKLKIYESINKEYKLSEHIIQHCFPLESKKAFPKKSNWISSKENKIGAHYIEKDMCGSYIKDVSNIMIIDIDCHKNNTLQAYNELLILLNHFNNYLYLEISYEGSFHLYIKLDKEYSYIERKEYLNKLKKEKNLLCVDLHIKMRFPFSYHYEPCTEEMEILSIQNSIKTINKKYKKQIGFNLNIQQKEKVIPIISTLYGRKKKSKIKHITSEEFLSSTDLNISYKNRHNPMLEICRIGKFNNWNYGEILYVIRTLDQGSEDLKKLNDKKLLKNIENICNKSTIYYQKSITTKPEKFISNIDKLPINIKNVLEDESFINKVILNCERKITPINQQKFKIILLELFGAILYDTQNNRITLNNKKNKYLIGKQFSSYFANKLKEHYSEIQSFDCYGIIKDILNKSNLFIQFKSNIRGWYFNTLNSENNFCKQFDLSNNKNHILFNNYNTICYLIINLLNSFTTTKSKLLTIQDFFNNKDNEFLIIEDKFLLDVG